MSPRVRELLIWVALVATIVLGAAALAGPVHDVLVDLGWLAPDPGLPDKPFLKVFRRLLLIPLVIVFFWRLRPWRDGNLASYGLRGPDARLGPAFLGFGIVLTIGVLLIAWQLAMGWLVWEEPLRMDKFYKRAARYLGSGLLIGLVEEWFFRGWLLRRLRRRMALVWAALVGAAIYALVHAFKPSNLNDLRVTHDMRGALEALVAWLGHMVDPGAFGPAFLGLFFFGLVLTAAYLRTHTLWTPVGIHAAGVFVIYTYGALTDRTVRETWAGTKRLYDGPPLWVLLAVIAFLLWPKARGGQKRA